MSTISALTSRNLPASLYAGSSQIDSKTNASRQVKASDTVPASANPVSSIASSSASNALDQHLAAVGNDTIDYAQSFLSSFAQSLFGSSGKDAQISFDSASLDTSSTVAAGVRQSSGSFGSSSAAAFQLSDSSHFIGKGTITTADGRKFDFEVEVQYDAQLSAAASRSSNTLNDSAQTNRSLTTNASDLPKVQVPNIDFPGTLSDLFKLIGLDLQTALSTGDNTPDRSSDGIDRNTLRSLSLRLLNLVNSKDTNTYSAPSAADKAKAATAGDADASKAQAAPASSADTGTSAAAASNAVVSNTVASAPDQDGDSDSRQTVADIGA
ncbi:hypothetical protein ACFFKC_17810 [Pseudoduganella danionis]|uniref:DUF5610 domain-containing protein n=1 Tax=Pseudoduganella danionis TaxID=1890295 RepID=A0ABW9SNG6_9BURK|nr:hypothetical protein [Pseudoduganella danionis]MTW33737.1 hypothetical protein [Pseudoduganella danionis]